MERPPTDLRVSETTNSSRNNYELHALVRLFCKLQVWGLREAECHFFLLPKLFSKTPSVNPRVWSK